MSRFFLKNINSFKDNYLGSSYSKHPDFRKIIISRLISSPVELKSANGLLS